MAARKRKKTVGHPANRQGPARQVATRVTAADWISAARLRTLPLAIAPVALGTGAAAVTGGWTWWLALLCLAVALFLQIGVNYANDYSDGVRGTDDHRVGPARLTASGRVKPRAVMVVAFTFFALAGASGLAITILTGHWWFLAVGAACIAAAWLYTGGKRPYGYYGLGELFVFVFFGLVATVGTTFVQTGWADLETWLGAVGIGLLACAVLILNNVRDIVQDRAAGKRTLSVLIGRRWSLVLYTLFVGVPMLFPALYALLYPPAWLVYFTLLLAIPAVIIAWSGRTPRELILALQLTSFLSLAYGVGLGWAMFV